MVSEKESKSQNVGVTFQVESWKVLNFVPIIDLTPSLFVIVMMDTDDTRQAMNNSSGLHLSPER